MNVKLPKNDKLVLIGTILLVLFIFVGLYFFVLYPKMGQVPVKEIELSMQEELLATVQGQMTEKDTSTFENSVALQKLVPVKPLSQQLLLDIEKAEVVSGSFVVSMSFEDSEVTEDPFQQQLEETEEQEDENVEGEVEEEEKSHIPLPEGVMRLTATLNVESPTYFEFEEFISILENSERITVIESIDFNAGEEIIEEDQEDAPLSYSVRLSAFYMPSLADLIDRLPKMETPEPANKKHPFTRFGDLSDAVIENDDIIDEQTEQEETVETPPTASQGSLEYIVKPGDTVFNLSMRFYNSNKGMQKIRDANGIVDNKIYIGEKLHIPLD